MSLSRIQRRKSDFDSLWLITFADLMIQLMACFVLLYSFDMQDQNKTSELLNSLRRALKVSTASQGEGILPGQTGIAMDRATDLEKLISDMKTSEGADEGRRMRIVSFRGSLLFSEGSITVDTTFQRLLERISELVKQYPGFQLICEGHAAPDEKGRGGVDAIELSGLRAQAAMRFLIAHGVEPRTVAAEAHGDTMIEGDPTSPEGRALQRRVSFRFQRVAER